MNCLDANEKMNDFLDDRLSFKELKAFTDHISTCKSCRDDTEVLMLIRASVEDPDEDLDSYDLSNLLDRKLKNQKRWFRTIRVISALMIFATLVLALVMVYLLLNQ